MKKIMFNDRYGLTKAVLEGRKTQTRRILDPTMLFRRMKTFEGWSEEDIGTHIPMVLLQFATQRKRQRRYARNIVESASLCTTI